jgi:hypothetical protein
MNRKVIRDMKCDMDQFDRIMDLLEVAEKKSQQKTNEAMNRLNFNAGGAPPTPEMIKKMIRDAHDAGDKEFRAAVEKVWTDILTPAQRKRFREIDLQARGHEAFTTPGVSRALDITAKQKEQLDANIKRVEEDIIQGFQKPQLGPLPAGAPPDYREPHIPTARAEGMKRALAILTDDQRTTWKKLTGELFTHPLPLPTVGSPDHIGFGTDDIGFANDLPALPAKPPFNPGK